MKNGLLKAFSMILALCIMLSSVSIVTFAQTETDLEALGGKVELDLTNDGTVTVSVVAKEELICYSLEGFCGLKEEGETEYFTLTAITSDVLEFDSGYQNFVDVESGKVMWVDDFFTSSPISAGSKLISATYKVAADTPDGVYKVALFTTEIFTGADGEPVEEKVVYEAEITVTHKCKGEEQAAKAPECEIDGWIAYYQCPRCEKLYADADATEAIEDLDAWKKAEGNIPAIGHKNEDNDHVCDNGCGEPFGECVDEDLDHACDYGCGKAYGVHEDKDLDHVCDYGCDEPIGECVDADHDHFCDHGCEKVFGEHIDEDFDHACDYGCEDSIGEHKDEDSDHACDYGCDEAIGEHKDTNKDHVCEYGCGNPVGVCEDKDLNHYCDYGCGAEFGVCDDVNHDHICDYGCKLIYGWPQHRDYNQNHICDYAEGYEGGCADNFGEHEPAEGAHECAYCGEKMTFCTETLEKTDAVEATCETAGNSEYYYCSVCKTYYSDAEAKKSIAKDSWVIPALGHTEVIDEAVAPTCTETGLTEGIHCSVCGEVLKAQETVDALGHTEGEAVVENNVAPDCENAGSYDKVVYCTVCDAELSRETIVVDALGHDWGEVEYTDNKDGTHTASRVCGNDGEHVDSEEPEEHQYVEGSCVCGATEPVAGTMKGDIDLDGDVDARDLTLMARHIAKIESITDPAALDNADINSDGDISALDLTKLARHIAKIESIN